MFTTQNIIINLFFIPVYQLLFYTIQLVTIKKNSNRSRWYMGLLLLSLTIYLIANLLFHMNYQRVMVWAYYIFVPSFLLIIPLFYKYLLSITDTKKSGFEGKNITLFTPAVLLLILNIITYGNLPYVDKLSFLTSGFVIPTDFSLLQLTTEIVFYIGFVVLLLAQILHYTAKIVIILKYSKLQMERDASFLPYVNIRWINYIFGSILFFIFINVIFNLLVNTENTNILLSYNILMIITGGIIGYWGLKQENLHEFILKLSDVSSDKTADLSNSIKEKVISINDEEKLEIQESLKKLMELEKPYLNSNLSLNDLALKLNINKRTLSSVINDEMETNIYGFINDYRINEFIKIISEEEMDYLSIEGIAGKVGFKSKSSFNACFKKATGKTPSQYKRDIRKEVEG